MCRQFYVYILANRSRTLYVGVTGDITARMLQHKTGLGSRFTQRYALTRLVHIEVSNTARDAIAREKGIKGWSRAKKVALIESANPTWTDLADDWFDSDSALYRDASDPSPDGSG